MKRFILVLLLAAAGISAEFQSFKYHADYFHKDSVTSATLKPTIDELTCGVYCNVMDCMTFVNTLSLETCQSISNPQALVKTSKRNPNAVKVWSSSPFATVPHLLLFKNDQFEDYSLDAEVSSPITSYPAQPFPSTAEQCSLFFPHERKVIMRTRTSPTLYQWYIGESSATQLSSTINDPIPVRYDAIYATHEKTGKMILYSGTYGGVYHKNAYIYQGGQGKMIAAPIGRSDGCAAFHPSNDNILYLFGGYEEGQGSTTHAFAFHLNDSSIVNLRNMDQTRYNPSCIGYIDKSGQPAILIAGGSDLDTMVEYGITSNVYTDRPNIPGGATRGSHLFIREGYLYIVGGFGGNLKKVARINLSFTEPWQEFPNLQSLQGGTSRTILLPYN